MKKFSKILLAMTLALALLFAAGCGATTEAPAETPAETPADAPAVTPDEDYVFEERTFKLGHALSADSHYQVGSEYFAKLINERTNGAVTVEVYPSSQLGGEANMIESLQMGTLDFCLTTGSVLSGFDDSFFIYNMPFLMESDEHVFSVLDGEFGQKQLANLSNIGIKGLAFWECGWFGFIYNGDPILVPSDLAGTAFRTMETTLTMSWFKALNSNPIPMAWAEVFTALQNGTFDGTILPVPTIYTNSIHTVADKYSRVNLNYDPLPLLMSQSIWDSLDPELQTVIQEAAVEAMTYQRDYAHNAIEDMAAAMTEEGCTIYEFTTEERQVWIDTMRTDVWPTLLETGLVTQEAIDEVLSYAK